MIGYNRFIIDFRVKVRNCFDFCVRKIQGCPKRGSSACLHVKQTLTQHRPKESDMEIALDVEQHSADLRLNEVPSSQHCYGNSMSYYCS